MFKPLALAERNRLCVVALLGITFRKQLATPPLLGRWGVPPQRLLKCKRERFEHFRLLNFEPLRRQVLSLRKCDQTVRRGGGIGEAALRFDFPKVTFPNPFPCLRTRLLCIPWLKNVLPPSNMGSDVLDSAKHSSQLPPSPNLCVFNDGGQ